MTLIRESLNFERGLDPKKAMKIGRDALIEKIEWDLNLLDQPDVRVVDFIQSYRGFPILVYDFGDCFRATSILDHTGMTLSVGTALSAMKRKINALLSKADDNFIQKWFPGYVRESQNFERGLDPKEAMGIGMEARKKKLDKETDWGFEFSHAFQVRTYDIIEYEGLLIKIVKIMGSDGIAYYSALNNTGEPYMGTPPLYNTPEEALDWEKKYIDQYIMEL